MAIDFSEQQKPSNKRKGVASSSIVSRLSARKLTATHRKFFTEQLALLLETGNSLHGSLEILEMQSDHKEMKEMLSELHRRVTKGQTFSQALKHFSKLFSPTYITLIAAAEQGGYLATVLSHLLKMEEKREELRSMVVSAFFYPAVLILFSILVVAFVLTTIFPKFTALFLSSGIQLPPVTQMLMSASDFLLDYWWAIVLFIVMVGLYLRTKLSNPASRARLDEMLLTTPLLGALLVKIYITHMMRLLHLSLENGVTLIDALTICKDASKNKAFQGFVDGLVRNVNEGKDLGTGFRESRFIPTLIKQMIQTGEESGKLPLVTGRVADYYQKELEKNLSMMAKIIEPVMLLGMGIFVAFIVSALILPIFKLSSTMQ